LILRDWRDDDIDAWVRMNAHPRVMEFFPQRHPRERSEANAVAIGFATVQRLRRELSENGYGWWAVEIRGGASFAGVIVLQAVPFAAPFTPANEIGWRFAFEHWGRGYATEGARAALQFAFNELGWREVVALTAVSNLRSQRVMQRLGMTHDPLDDFDHPKIEPGHPLHRHVLYRIKNSRN
jgi:RimJ/RimL family protein N-acetyltransferase